ncbi:hypothetical protein MP213Fo_22650 [Pseudochrobactrum sp. MP213Fo]
MFFVYLTVQYGVTTRCNMQHITTELLLMKMFVMFFWSYAFISC